MQLPSLLLLLCIGWSSANELLVQTPSGPIEGFTLTTFTGKDIKAFFGVPFAQPPVGDLRFKKPVPVEPWTQTLEAKSLPLVCPQVWMEVFFNEKEKPMSEDCLYLTISVPKNAQKGSKVPVMVRFHGGGFITGGISLIYSNTTAIVGEENVIVVSAQYRLGVLGFLYMGTSNAPGNMGLWDQNLALKWVKENIESFGGDPDSITIFGESAGSASVNYHLLSKHSHPYYQRAIMDSGSALNIWAFMEPQENLEYAHKLAEAVGCGKEASPDEVVKCLQSVDSIKLVTETANVAPRSLARFIFVPTLDMDFITSSPDELASTGNIKNTNLLIGVAQNEGMLLVPMYVRVPIEQITRSHFKAIAGMYAPGGDKLIADVISYLYTNWSNPDSNWNSVLSLDSLFSDCVFNCGMNDFVDHAVDVETSVYKFLFDYPQNTPLFPNSLFSLHVAQYLHWSGANLNPHMNYGPDSHAVSMKLMRMFANFARTGDPNMSPDGSTLRTRWPKYTKEHREYFLIEEKQEKVQYGFRDNICAFWKELLPKLVHVRDHCDLI